MLTTLRMKYIRAVLTRLMIRSNTERFFFIQSVSFVLTGLAAELTPSQYIPVYQ